MVNRLLTRNDPDSQNDTFIYDLASRLTQATSARYENTVTRTYSNDGTLVGESCDIIWVLIGVS